MPVADWEYFVCDRSMNVGGYKDSAITIDATGRPNSMCLFFFYLPIIFRKSIMLYGISIRKTGGSICRFTSGFVFWSLQAVDSSLMGQWQELVSKNSRFKQSSGLHETLNLPDKFDRRSPYATNPPKPIQEAASSFKLLLYVRVTRYLCFVTVAFPGAVYSFTESCQSHPDKPRIDANSGLLPHHLLKNCLDNAPTPEQNFCRLRIILRQKIKLPQHSGVAPKVKFYMRDPLHSRAP